MKRNAFFSLILLSLGMLAFQAQAYTCTTTTASTTITAPNITVQRDLPVGSVIGSQIATSNIPAFTCTNEAPKLTYQQTGIKAYGTYVTSIAQRRIYSTNIAGVGYAIGSTIVSACGGYSYYVIGSGSIDGSPDNRIGCAVNGIFANQPITAQVLITFYKTAQTTGSGTVSGQQVASLFLYNDQSTFQTPESIVNLSSFNITTLACTVNNTAISVPMGDIEKRSFSGVGTWPGDANTKSFTIPLTCDAGTRVNVQIDGSVQNASQGVLNLNSGANSASGVGIQLLYNDSPLVLGTAFLTGTSASQGTFNIPLKARYYQTASNISTGTANGSATFTLTYQ